MSNITKIKVDQTIYDVGTPIDTELSSTSTNPVQNKVITEKLNSLRAEEIEYDDTSFSLGLNNVQDVIDKIAAFSHPTLIVNVKAGSSITISNGSITITGTANNQNKFETSIPEFGAWNISASLNGKTTNDDITINTNNIYQIELSFLKIYGVSWSLGATTNLSRIDDSALFTDPNPYMADGSHPGSSPFDNLYPWNGMIRETIDGNEMVKIPKFWYKIQKNNSTLKIQIATEQTDGFSVSPAHRARGSESEHDYIWIGRYHCDDNYKSISGVSPISKITRATARTAIRNLGSNYWQIDYSLLITIWLLYIVEFADWNSQTKIGYGCGNNSSKVSVGASDSMPYHTGTMQASRTTYGVGVQYRYIEDLWGNVLDWCDGIVFSGANIYGFEDPENYSDSYSSTGAILLGTRATSSGFIQSLEVSTETGYEWFLYPSTTGGSSTSYISDYFYYGSSGTVFCFGGDYGRSTYYGLFCFCGDRTSSTKYIGIGTRLQYRQSSS